MSVLEYLFSLSIVNTYIIDMGQRLMYVTGPLMYRTGKEEGQLYKYKLNIGVQGVNLRCWRYTHILYKSHKTINYTHHPIPQCQHTLGGYYQTQLNIICITMLRTSPLALYLNSEKGPQLIRILFNGNDLIILRKYTEICICN